MREPAAFFGLAQHGVHARAARDDVAERERAGAAALQALNFGFERARIERVRKADLQPLDADRLDHEVDRARPHRRDHVVDAAMGGLHDHRHRRPGLAHLREHAEPVEIGHDEIEHDAVDAWLGCREGSERGIPALGEHDFVAEPPHHVVQEAALDGIVVDDQDGGGHAGPFKAVPIGALLPEGDLTGC